jgi:hypothetical protein
VPGFNAITPTQVASIETLGRAIIIILKKDKKFPFYLSHSLDSAISTVLMESQ